MGGAGTRWERLASGEAKMAGEDFDAAWAVAFGLALALLSALLTAILALV